VLDKWLAPQLSPTLYINFLQLLVEIFLHSSPIHFWLIKGEYKGLIDFVAQERKDVIQWAETEFGSSKEKATHNLFLFGFNGFGDFSRFLSTLLIVFGTNTNGLQERLGEEV